MGTVIIKNIYKSDSEKERIDKIKNLIRKKIRFDHIFNIK